MHDKIDSSCKVCWDSENIAHGQPSPRLSLALAMLGS